MTPGALPQTPRFIALVSSVTALGLCIVETAPSEQRRHPYKPTWALGSLLSVALSSHMVKQKKCSIIFI